MFQEDHLQHTAEDEASEKEEDLDDSGNFSTSEDEDGLGSPRRPIVQEASLAMT